LHPDYVAGHAHFWRVSTKETSNMASIETPQAAPEKQQHSDGQAGRQSNIDVVNLWQENSKTTTDRHSSTSAAGLPDLSIDEGTADTTAIPIPEEMDKSAAGDWFKHLWHDITHNPPHAETGPMIHGSGTTAADAIKDNHAAGFFIGLADGLVGNFPFGGPLAEGAMASDKTVQEALSTKEGQWGQKVGKQIDMAILSIPLGKQILKAILGSGEAAAEAAVAGGASEAEAVAAAGAAEASEIAAGAAAAVVIE
jgi:hypothetical protein